jgi:hypothetical protein
MKTKNLLVFGLGIFLFLTGLTVKVYGQREHEHPSYLRALSDLRSARWLIENRPETSWKKTMEEDEAVRQIDDAINRIKRASIDDHKDIHEHEPVDEHPKQRERLREAIDYLYSAYHDVNKEEDNAFAGGLRNQALGNIRTAISAVQKALQPDHPNYYEAISDLRAARWLIDHRPETTWQKTMDEDEAVRQIDAALNRMKQASIDDGKNPNEHVPVDERPKQLDRLKEAIEFLNKASQDISREEDNAFAGGLRNQALGNIRASIAAVNKALTPVHPNYLTALSDLRAARWLIDHRPETTWQKTQDEDEAVRQIDAAMNRIKQASIDDGKNTNEHPPVDERPKQMDRLKEAIDYLNKASGDINKEEDNAYAGGLRNLALGDIRAATNAVNKALIPVHPNYLQALSDLRAARWLIDHHTMDWKQNQDEMEAVRQIDGAINEIKKAAIDDGKNINDHPPVDEKADRHGRLGKALEFLRKANADISKEEDNAGAQGLRNRASGLINQAIGSTEKAMRQ